MKLTEGRKSISKLFVGNKQPLFSFDARETEGVTVFFLSKALEDVRRYSDTVREKGRKSLREKVREKDKRQKIEIKKEREWKVCVCVRERGKKGG